jgi:hypothetical protein
VAKLTGIDMGDASIRRVLNADQLAAALESGSYSNVIYFGHVYNGNLAPTGPKGDQISVADFEGMLGAGVTNVAVIGCRSEGFAAQLNQLKPEIQTEGMRGDLYASVLNGAITSVWMGTRTASHVPIVLERFGEIY